MHFIELDIESEAVVQRCSVKKNFLKFLLVKKGLWHPCFPVNFAKFLTFFFKEHLWCLFL